MHYDRIGAQRKYETIGSGTKQPIHSKRVGEYPKSIDGLLLVYLTGAKDDIGKRQMVKRIGECLGFKA